MRTLPGYRFARCWPECPDLSPSRDSCVRAPSPDYPGGPFAPLPGRPASGEPEDGSWSCISPCPGASTGSSTLALPPRVGRPNRLAVDRSSGPGSRPSSRRRTMARYRPERVRGLPGLSLKKRGPTTARMSSSRWHPSDRAYWMCGRSRSASSSMTPAHTFYAVVSLLPLIARAASCPALLGT